MYLGSNEVPDFVEVPVTFEKIELLTDGGGVSLSYVVRINGKEYFMKQLRPEYASELRYRTLFFKEYETGRRISNEHIVKYESIGENADGLYLLMEYINGSTLEEKVANEPEWFASESNMERFLFQLLDGLKTLHDQNVAFLDLSPRNIMFAQVSGGVKIVDLGFCLTDGYAHTAGRTLGFAAPELEEGRLEDIDARTDIYAVGRLMKYIEERAGVKYSRRMRNIMRRCLKEDRHERFENVEMIRMALNQKRRIMRTVTVLCSIIAVIAAIWGWKNFEGTEEHKQLMMYLESDAEVGGIYYVITSKDSATCMAIGRKTKLEEDKETGDVSIYMTDKLDIGGKDYVVTKISDWAFFNYQDITSVSFSSALKEIGAYAFCEDSSLVYASIPEGVTTMGDHVFFSAALRGVKLPGSLRIIDNASFAKNRFLEEVVIPEGVETLGVDAFGGCISLRSVTLPSTLKTIRRGVFWECGKLTEITIPAACSTIGEYAFFYCDSLKDVYNLSPEPQDIPRIFNRKDITVHVQASSAEKYRNAQHWGDLTIVGDL